MKTKFILKRVAEYFEFLRFDEKSFFKTLLGFTPCWDYKRCIAILDDSPRVYTSKKILKLSTID